MKAIYKSPAQNFNMETHNKKIRTSSKLYKEELIYVLMLACNIFRIKDNNVIESIYKNSFSDHLHTRFSEHMWGLFRPWRVRKWQPLPFLVSRLTSAILLTPFHLMISPLSIRLIFPLILNSLFEKAYLFPNLSFLSTKASHSHHFLYSSRFQHGLTWNWV